MLLTWLLSPKNIKPKNNKSTWEICKKYFLIEWDLMKTIKTLKFFSWSLFYGFNYKNLNHALKFKNTTSCILSYSDLMPIGHMI